MNIARLPLPLILVGAVFVWLELLYVSFVVAEVWSDNGLAELRDEFTATSDAVPDGGTLRVGDAATSVEWDCLFVFRPYTPAEEIDETLGYTWKPGKHTDIENSEENNLVILVADGDITGYFTLARRVADFDVPSGSGYTPDATFSLDRDAFEPMLQFIGTSDQSCR